MIRLDDYEESEDLTPDMVREYATKAGYGLSQAGLRAPNQGGFITYANPMRDDAMPWLVECLAGREQRSIQSLLREIHPRMRRGRPSQAERDAHEGPWLASLPGSHVLLVGNFSDDGETFFPGLAGPMRNTCEGAQDWMDAWAFWPCDQHGNKTRRGA